MGEVSPWVMPLNGGRRIKKLHQLRYNEDSDNEEDARKFIIPDTLPKEYVSHRRIVEAPAY